VRRVGWAGWSECFASEPLVDAERAAWAEVERIRAMLR